MKGRGNSREAQFRVFDRCQTTFRKLMEGLKKCFSTLLSAKNNVTVVEIFVHNIIAILQTSKTN